MGIYLLKFSACLVVFWLIYIVVLEGQKMHQFKRFYLIGSILSAIVIPLLTITYYVDPVVQKFEAAPQYIPIEWTSEDITISEAPAISFETILWYLYGVGVLLFSIRFIVNLTKLYRTISQNEKVSKQTFIYVLLNQYLIPHSFFKYIFLNKSRYEIGTIPKEVLLHEETHAKQLHSLDIIILELLQIVFWFHPFIYVIKHHIKLNHEFLADQAVLNEGTDTKNYQNILLQFSSNTPEYQLSSAINYSSFKKRFTVMKTQTSKTKKWLSTLILIPITALLFYSFAERKALVKDDLASNLFLVTIEKNEDGIELKCESGCKWSRIILENRSEPYIINDYGFSEGKTLDTDQFAFSIEPNAKGVKLNGLKGTSWFDLNFNLPKNKIQAINQLGTTSTSPNSIKKERESKVLSMKAINNTLFIGAKKSSLKTYVEDLNDITSKWTAEDFEITYLDLKTQNCSEKFLNTLNELHKNTDHFLITALGTKSLEGNQNKVVTAYNKKYEIYKKLQETPPHYIEKPEVVQKQMDDLFSDLGGIYFTMSKENKNKVKKPTAPILPYVKITLNGKTYFKEYKDLTQEEQATLTPSLNKTSKGGPNAGEIQHVYNPSFLEYIIEMEQLGASFYLDGKKITVQQAKSIAQNHKGKQTEMLTQKGANGKYIVKLSSSIEVQKQKATKEQIAEYNSLAQKYNEQPEDKRVVKLKDLKRLEYVYKLMSEQQRQNAQPFPNCPPTPEFQKGASDEQLKAYNKLAKHYNKMLANGKNIRIKMKEVERLQYIYTLMSDKQRKNAEPFPDFPEPPAPPPAPEEPKFKAKEIKEVQPPKPPKAVKIKRAKASTKALTKEKKARKAKDKSIKEIKSPSAELVDVPPPPPPPVPLDFVIEMAKTNAKFFNEGDPISSDKAIELLKKDPELNIKAQKTDSGQVFVYISEKPIVIKRKEKSRN